MNLLVISVVVVLAIAENGVRAKTKVIACYYVSWAIYRQNEGKVTVNNIDPQLCTHIIYTFIGISPEGGVKHLDPWNDLELKGFEKLQDLKQINPNLKVLVAIGGWNEGAATFSKVAANPSLTATFAENVVDFLKKHRFDGLDMDWEYPADPQRGGGSNDKKNFTDMLSALSKVLKPLNLLLTAAVGVGKSRRVLSYDVLGMNKYLDFINLMTFDMHGVWDKKVGHNAPMYARASDNDKTNNIDAVVNDWLTEGADPQKLVLGLALYGRSFTLRNASNRKVGAPTTGAGSAGELTKQPGILSYLEICKKLKQGWQEEWNNEEMVPYAYNGNEVVVYDNPKSLQIKVDLAKKYNLAGVMVWSIDQDDIKNTCGRGQYPLLNAIHKSIESSYSGVILSLPESTTAKETPSKTTAKPAIISDSTGCPDSGPFFVDPMDCGTFYQCNGNIKFKFQCPPGLKYDKTSNSCNYKDQVKC